VCLCRRRMGVCAAYVSDLRSPRVPHKARPEEKLHIGGRIMIMIIIVIIIIMLPTIRSVYTKRTQHDRPRSLNVCIHPVPGVAFVRPTRSTLVVYRACTCHHIIVVMINRDALKRFRVSTLPTYMNFLLIFNFKFLSRVGGEFYYNNIRNRSQWIITMIWYENINNVYYIP